MAVYDSTKGLLSHALSSQVATHRRFGGVVPELASRDHLKCIVPLLDEVLHQAHTSSSQLDAVAYTAGPGLVGALLTGASFAKSLAFAWNIHSLGVHHLEAHLLAAQLDTPSLEFPFLVLLVSGGHTQLLEASSLGKYQLLGDTLDDAVGEAFDKTAKVMGLPYPGGPLLAKMADACLLEASFAKFPRPMIDRPGLDFSFSGLKTHVLTVWNNSDKTEGQRQLIAKAFQEAVVDTLVIKVKRALEVTGHKRLVVAGGVGANRALREALGRLMDSMSGQVYFPRMEYCTDNGAMVAYAGCLHLLQGQCDDSLAIKVLPRWPLANNISD